MEGLVICAEFQTKGRGRLGRIWHAPAGKNLLVSLLLRPDIDIKNSQKITLGSAIVLEKVLKKYCTMNNQQHIQFELKWPNDVLVDGKKIAGILVESILRENKIEALALGFGINLNMDPELLPEDLRQQTTSLALVINQLIDRELFLVMLLEQMDIDYQIMEKTQYSEVVNEWKLRTRHLGKQIRISDSSGVFNAQFKDVSERGYLIYGTADGKTNEFISGEVSWI
jgi:BirA family biotin operon repressor/biotin-[acetyl-CoA-carboxylase] ligase